MSWDVFLENQREQQYFKDLMVFVDEQRKNETVYPPEDLVFKAFECNYDAIKVVILGQDPYHQKGQAMGLSFSVNPEFPLPKSLVNIYKELKNDTGDVRTNGDLSDWHEQGVFLLNALLSVRDSEPASHKNKGWEVFTDNAIAYLSERKDPIVFILWGKWAESKMKLIANHHVCLVSAHPSPLGAYRGFWDSKPFSKTNKILTDMGKTPIRWGE